MRRVFKRALGIRVMTALAGAPSLMAMMLTAPAVAAGAIPVHK